MSQKNRARGRPGGRTEEPEIAPNVQAILDASRAMTANGTEPRKHHLVPRFYLNRWAENDRVRVTDLDSGSRSYTVSPSNALVEIDYYRLPEGTVKDGSPITWEVWLSDVEGKANAAFRAIDSDGLGNLDRGGWSDFLVFLGVQMTRTRAFRYKGRWMTGPGQYRMFEFDKPGAIKALLTRMGEDASPEQVAEVTAYFEKATADPWSVPVDAGMEMDTSIRAARGLAEELSTRKFLLFDTARPLMTCDEPIVELYPRMDAPPPILQGGVHGAPIIAFPFGPSKVLAMFRSNMPVQGPLQLSAFETLELNRAIAGNAHRYLVESPSSRLGAKLFIPESKKDPIHIEEVGDLVSTIIQRRWHGHSNAPNRAVASWWPAVVPPAPRPPATQEDWDRERAAYER